MNSSFLDNSDSSCLSSSIACSSCLLSDSSLVVSEDSFLEEVKKTAVNRRVIRPRLSVSTMRNSVHRKSESGAQSVAPVPRKSIVLQSPLIESPAKVPAPSPTIQPDALLDGHQSIVSRYSEWIALVRSLHASLSNRAGTR